MKKETDRHESETCLEVKKTGTWGKFTEERKSNVLPKMAHKFTKMKWFWAEP